MKTKILRYRKLGYDNNPIGFLGNRHGSWMVHIKVRKRKNQLNHSCFITKRKTQQIQINNTHCDFVKFLCGYGDVTLINFK